MSITPQQIFQAIVESEQIAAAIAEFIGESTHTILKVAQEQLPPIKPVGEDVATPYDAAKKAAEDK
jgi:hypothetical protein